MFKLLLKKRKLFSSTIIPRKILRLLQASLISSGGGICTHEPCGLGYEPSEFDYFSTPQC